MELNYVLQEAHVLFDYGIKKEMVIYSSSGIAVKSSTKEDLSRDKKIRILTRASLILLGMRQIANSEHFDGVLKFCHIYNREKKIIQLKV